MNPLEFAGEVILVSATGVLSPGPLFFTNIIYRSKQGVTAGIKIAFGHTIVEFPLVIALALGLFTFSYVLANNEYLKIISIIGGIAIVVFAFTQIISITKGKVNRQNAYVGISAKKGPILLGVIFSVLNPFFFNLVAHSRLKTDFRFNSILRFCDWNSFFVFISYMDGLCLVSDNIVSDI